MSFDVSTYSPSSMTDTADIGSLHTLQKVLPLTSPATSVSRISRTVTQPRPFPMSMHI